MAGAISSLPPYPNEENTMSSTRYKVRTDGTQHTDFEAAEQHARSLGPGAHTIAVRHHSPIQGNNGGSTVTQEHEVINPHDESLAERCFRVRRGEIAGLTELRADIEALPDHGREYWRAELERAERLGGGGQ